MHATTFQIAKTPFAIDYLMEEGKTENDQKTIEILYHLTDKNSTQVGILRVLNRLVNSVSERKFFEWVDSSIEIESGFIHFLSCERQLKQNQWEQWNNDPVVNYHGTGYGSLVGNNYLIEIDFDQGVPVKMNIVQK